MKAPFPPHTIAAILISTYLATIAGAIISNRLSWPPDVAAAISMATHVAAFVSAVVFGGVQRYLAHLDRYQAVSRSSFQAWKRWRQAIVDDDILTQMAIEELVKHDFDR
jgi:hypothetical protein